MRLDCECIRDLLLNAAVQFAATTALQRAMSAAKTCLMG